MTQLAAIHAKITGDASGLKAAATSAKAELAGVGRAASAAQTQASGLTTSFGGLGGSMARNSHQIRMAGMQLSQVGQQTMATGNFVKSLAIQLPDLGLAFGNVGIAVGLLAGIALPMVVSALGGAGDKSEDVQKQLEGLVGAIEDYRSAAELAIASTDTLTERFGSQSEKIRETLNLLQSIALSKALDSLNVSMSQVDTTRLRHLVDIIDEGKGEIDAFNDNFKRANAELQEGFRLSADQARQLLAAIEAMRSANGPEAVAESARALNALLLDIYGTVQNIPPEFRDMAEFAGQADVAASSIIGTMEAVAAAAGGAADEAARLAANLMAAAQINATGFGNDFTQLPGEGASAAVAEQRVGSLQGAWRASQRGARGGGGKKGGARTDPIVAELERLSESLMTAEEMQIESFARQQETLQEALEKRLITQQEYADLMESAQSAHADRMAQIDVYRYGDTLQKTGAFMGAMAAALQSGNDKMMRIAKVFAAGEALVNAWRAYSQVLADPTLPFFAKIPAALSVLSAGIGAVNAIKGVGGGGGGGGGGTAAAASSGGGGDTQGGFSRNVAISLQGDIFGREQVISLINQINEAQEDGARIRLV